MTPLGNHSRSIEGADSRQGNGIDGVEKVSVTSKDDLQDRTKRGRDRTLLINKHDSGLAIFFTDVSRGSFV